MLAHPALRVVVAEEQWEETEHEFRRRIGAIVNQGRLTANQARLIDDAVHALLEDRAIEIIPRMHWPKTER